MKIYRLVLPLLAMICLHCSAQSNAEKEKQVKYEKLKFGIDSKKFHFIARSASSARGKTAQITGGYYLLLSGDSLFVDLPFFGTSSAPAYGGSPEDGGIKFNINDFKYASDSTKKGGWEITIEPNNQRNATKIALSITSTGSCRVSIFSSARSTMSYVGNVLSNFKD